MAELWVGAGKQFARISDAIAAAKSGDTIFVQAGVYTNDFAKIDKDLSIVGVGGKAHFKATIKVPNGKGIFVTNADVTFENVEFSGARVTDRNGAGIRHESGDLVVRNSYFHDCENGILTNNKSSATVTIEGSEFADIGRGDGQTHALYVNRVDRLTVTDSHFHDTLTGHHIKSRANHTEVRNSILDDGSGDSSYSIDLPEGGGAKIVGNTLIQGANAGNRYMIHYGGEVSTPKAGAVLIEDNTFINYRSAGGTAVYNQTGKTLDFKDNTLIGLSQAKEGGPLSQTGTAKGFLGSSGADSIVGSSGLDKIDYRFSPAAVEIDLSAGKAKDGYGATDTLSGIENAGGSRFADLIVGDGKANRLDGGAGADTLKGGGGNDVLKGGAGDDKIDGGAGTDTAVYARKASAYQVTVSGDEVVVKALSGKEGTDRLRNIEKLKFADKTVDAPVAAATKPDSESGSEPQPQPEPQPTPEPSAYDGKVIVGTGSYQNLYGSSKADFIQGMGGGDRLFGYAGDDRLDGGTGADWLYGGDGNDVLIGGAGNDVLKGEKGVDVAVYARKAADYVVTATADGVTVKALAGDEGVDQLFGVERIQFADKTIDALSEAVLAAEGSAPEPEASDDAPEPDVDPTPSEPAAYDGKVIVGTGSYQNLYGSSKADFIQGMGGGDRLFGYAGDDRLDGGTGADRLYGGDGKDVLIGGAGNDALKGEAGADTLIGGPGSDTLYGGAGDDLFVFAKGDGADVIADFGVGADAIDLRDFGIGSFSDLAELARDADDAVVIDLPGADSVTLSGQQLAALESDHFLL